jgi:hypothetical protein
MPGECARREPDWPWRAFSHPATDRALHRGDQTLLVRQECKTGSLAAPRFVLFLCRGGLKAAPSVSHRKSGVQIAVKNLSPVESSVPPCLSSCNSVIRPRGAQRKRKIFGYQRFPRRVGPRRERIGSRSQRSQLEAMCSIVDREARKETCTIDSACRAVFEIGGLASVAFGAGGRAGIGVEGPRKSIRGFVEAGTPAARGASGVGAAFFGPGSTAGKRIEFGGGSARSIGGFVEAGMLAARGVTGVGAAFFGPGSTTGKRIEFDGGSARSIGW